MSLINAEAPHGSLLPSNAERCFYCGALLRIDWPTVGLKHDLTHWVEWNGTTSNIAMHKPCAAMLITHLQRDLQR